MSQSRSREPGSPARQYDWSDVSSTAPVTSKAGRNKGGRSHRVGSASASNGSIELAGIDLSTEAAAEHYEQAVGEDSRHGPRDTVIDMAGNNYVMSEKNRAAAMAVSVQH